MLVNGYALNHTTLSVHRVPSLAAVPGAGLEKMVAAVSGAGFALNEEGGVLKISPDGLLRQASTVADVLALKFADGVVRAGC